MGDTVKIEIKDNIALITLNRPEALNAMSKEWVEDIHLAIDAIEQSGDVRVAIITGAGRAFCAGGDINHPGFTTDGFENRRQFVEPGYNMTKRIRKLPMPFIAAVNGAAAGAGVTVASICDIRIASESAFFRMDFVKVGALPDMGASYFLPKLIGISKAIEMSMLSEKVDAEEAKSIGLVSKVVPDDQLMEEAFKMAKRLASFPPLALRYIKRATYELQSKSMDDALDIEADYINYLMGTSDCREGTKAFLEKRPPVFIGE
ncbi:MAG: 2-(1,2-epoxy-1,2-dihydrophenyl)acetyl-CoA isomerase [Gammaproteobacteria bacterium]|jgi:2-(1,2-epoxy-1,2-dihydrophenyl)acetyl-CoA isomerase|nr:2-(1,2-epoxy-1,2-dihydrophenyl)acetyl-CoA isomerase [Gammaproteobacteria bacterium]